VEIAIDVMVRQTVTNPNLYVTQDSIILIKVI